MKCRMKFSHCDDIKETLLTWKSLIKSLVSTSNLNTRASAFCDQSRVQQEQAEFHGEDKVAFPKDSSEHKIRYTG